MNASVKQNPSQERDFSGAVQNSAYDSQKSCTTIRLRELIISKSASGKGLALSLSDASSFYYRPV
jgi:hypothetical protein